MRYSPGGSLFSPQGTTHSPAAARTPSVPSRPAPARPPEFTDHLCGPLKSHNPQESELLTSVTDVTAVPRVSISGQRSSSLQVLLVVLLLLLLLLLVVVVVVSRLSAPHPAGGSHSTAGHSQ